MKIVIFGVGGIYNKYKSFIAKEDEVVAFLDNNEKLKGIIVDGTQVYAPVDIQKLCYDKIVIMSNAAVAMREQLLELGCFPEKILHYIEYVRLAEFPNYRFENSKYEKKVLIITTPLGYHGGATAAVRAALALIEQGYDVIIAASAGDETFLKEFKNAKLHFWINQNFLHVPPVEMNWIYQFDMIIVNTYPMILWALKIAECRNVKLWIHESNIEEFPMIYWEKTIKKNVLNNPNLEVYAVSDVAKESFFENVTECHIEILAHGLPDVTNSEVCCFKEKITFAVIGSIFPLKQQHVFIEAIDRLEQKEKKKVKGVIIGKVADYNYWKKIRVMLDARDSIEYLDELTQKELMEKYRDIDVVVITSEKESLSFVAVEAMMRNKICIVNNRNGMKKYISDKVNGFIYDGSDILSLVEKMQYCIEHAESLMKMGLQARRTYEDVFSMKRFGERLTNII